MGHFHKEHGPFEVFIKTLTVPDLLWMRHEAIQMRDDESKAVIDAEFKRRERPLHLARPDDDARA